MRNDATSTELRDDRATQASSQRRATLSDTVLAGLSLPVWVLDIARIASDASPQHGTDDGRDRFLNDITVLATNAAALGFHAAASEAELIAARNRIFSSAAARAIVETARSDASGREIDIELGAIDGAARRARARIDRIATDASHHCCVLTILPSPPRANLLRVVPDVVFELDADGIYVDYAGPEEALLEPRQFIGKSITETLPADVAHRALAALQRLREHGGSECFEYALSMSDGLHWYEARLRALASGGAAAHVRDVTEHKSAEWRCQESEERCRVLGADLKARTVDLERAYRELEILRRGRTRPPSKPRTRTAQTK